MTHTNRIDPIIDHATTKLCSNCYASIIGGFGLSGCVRLSAGGVIHLTLCENCCALALHDACEGKPTFVTMLVAKTLVAHGAPGGIS